MDVLKTGRRLGRLMAFVGLACGVLYSVGGLVVDLLTIGLNRGTLMAFGALVGMPIIFGSVGFLAGVLVTFVANAVGSEREGS
jgi:hypothetical protein